MSYVSVIGENQVKEVEQAVDSKHIDVSHSPICKAVAGVHVKKPPVQILSVLIPMAREDHCLSGGGIGLFGNELEAEVTAAMMARLLGLKRC